MRKFAYALLGLLGSVGLAVAFALPAGAATHPAGVNNGAVYSTYLACDALNGNGDLKLYEVWAQLQNLPNPGTSVPALTLVQGFALTHSDVNGGPTYGLGARGRHR